MSNLYIPVTGIALHLTYAEYKMFLKNYMTVNNIVLEDIDPNDDFAKVLHFEDAHFLVSSNISKPSSDLPKTRATVDTDIMDRNFFRLEPIDGDDSSISLYTLEKKENPNKYEYKSNWIVKELVDGYLLYGKSVLPQDILSGNSYKSIDDIIAYYKDRMSAYLPDDFNWKSHIGFLQMITNI